jgi:DNA-binding MarR family transcriptional regulator
VTRRRHAQADELWRRLTGYMFDLRDQWRRELSESTGLSFGKLRVLRRLYDRPGTLRELAEAVGVDAPATTVLVNDLEARGLVVRAPHPTNRRAKIASLTPAGRELVAQALGAKERPPQAFLGTSASDLAALHRILDALAASRPRREKKSS